MKVFAEDRGCKGAPSEFILLLSKKEARILMDIADAAHEANKRRSSFRAWRKKLMEELSVF